MSYTSNTGVSIPAKRNRPPRSDSDSDSVDARPFVTLRHDDAIGLQTPPPSSPVEPFPTTPLHQTTSSLPSCTPPVTSSRPQLRVIYLQSIKERYPSLDVTNLSDFDILTLAGTRYDGTVDDIYEWLAHHFHTAARYIGSAERVLATSKDALDTQADITGLKPKCGDPNVKLCAIEGSTYLMRLWPGSLEGREWCLDFIDAGTSEPVNSPFKFKLWVVPDAVGFSSGPWQPAEAHRVYSLENRFGIKTRDIGKGAEKFVLIDGQTYVLWRPGQHQNIQFTVPSRPLPVVINNHTKIVSFQ
ncbi:hypothetical protein BC628DRAFT_1404790 [Trametes gibbosa]|nr:hypothetical protein BC628DRAFT_1404790 [Trametes gibbosa]